MCPLPVCFFSQTQYWDKVVAGSEFFAELPEAIVDTIWHLPETNVHQDLNRMYDSMEAYAIMREHKTVKPSYDFSEELPFKDTVYWFLWGQTKTAFQALWSWMYDFLVIFTFCNSVVLTFGCRDGKPYMIDTHSVTFALGKGEGENPSWWLERRTPQKCGYHSAFGFWKSCTTKA